MIEYYIDGQPHYLIGGKSYTEKELQAMKDATAMKDEATGYRDRMAGYYDKWYRYNRNDNGAAYDRGAERAAKEMKCPNIMHIIECVH